MVKKLIAISTAVFVAMPVFAQAAITPVFNPETKTVTVEGTVTGQGDVQLMVIDVIPQDEIFDTLTHEQMREHTKYLRQVASQNGSYTHTFKLSDYGVYTIFAGDGESTEYKAFSAYDPDFVTNFQAQTSEENMGIYINTSTKSYMRAEIPEYYELDSVNQAAIIHKIFNSRATLNSMELIKKEFEFLIMLENMKKTDINDEEILALFTEEQQQNLRVKDFERNNIYKAADNIFKAEVLRRIISSDVAGAALLRTAFNEAVILEQVEAALNYQAIYQLVADAKTLFSLTTPNYDALGENTKTVDEAVMNNDYASLTAFINAVENAAQSYTPPVATQRPSYNVGGGGGGGGGGSASGVTTNNSSITKPIQTPQPSEAPVQIQTQFSDVTSDRWSYEAINVLNKRGVIAGDGKGNFRPTDPVTREEFVKIAILAFGLEDKSAKCDFADVTESSWSYSYIASAKQYEIVSGISEERFAPKSGITREAAAVIINNIAKVKSMALSIQRDKAKFDDDQDVSDWANQAIDYLYQCGIINGKSETEFAPKSGITREETAMLIFNLLKQVS